MKTSSIGSVKQTYKFLASIYDLIYGQTLQNGREALGVQLASERGQRILEIGVGTGLMLPLYPIPSEITGVDVSAEMLQKAEQNVQARGLKNISLLLADGEHTALESDYFHHVVLAYIYSVTPQPEALIAEAFRVCKPGGHIWILNHFSGMGGWNFIESVIKPLSHRLGFRSIFPFAQFVTAKNWDIVSIQKVNVFGLSRLIKIKKSFADH